MNYSQTSLGLVINRHTGLNQTQSVTILTPYLGKVRIFWKQGITSKTHRNSKLQLGNIVKVQFHQKDKFSWLSEVETVSAFLNHPQNLSQLSLLFYLLEIINRLTADLQHTPNLYHTATKAIKSIQKNNFKSFIQAEILLLQQLGFGVPSQIDQLFHHSDFGNCQKQLSQHINSILEQPLESPKLFR